MVTAALLIGGAALAIANIATDDGTVVDERIDLPTQRNVSADQAREISRFSVLREPSEKRLAELTPGNLQWVDHGLSTATQKSGDDAISAIGALRTSRDSEILVYSAGDQICVYSSTVDDRGSGGTCQDLDTAKFGQVYSTGTYGEGPEFYVLGLMPDEVVSLEPTTKIDGDIELDGNVYEGVLMPENIILEGKNKDGEIVTRVSIPMGMFAEG